MKEVVERDLYAPLQGRRIVLGLTSSSAIYRSIDLARRLIRQGGEIDVVMTRESLKLIGVDLVEWAIGRKPYIEVTGGVEHVKLSSTTDALVIAPATLKTLAKIAYGLTDDLLSLLATAMLGRGRKVIVVPTMNIALYNSPQARDVLKRLNEIGVYVIPPFIEEDRVKYPPLADLEYCIETIINRGRDLEGYRALVTAGPTREYIDPVRVITNPSSGLMGVLIAREIACRGGIVDLVHGPLSVDKPYMVKSHSVETTSEMASVVGELASRNKYDIAVHTAAPVDYTPAIRAGGKISSRERRELTIILRSTPKVVKSMLQYGKPKVNVIFTAETAETYGELVEKAKIKHVDYSADLTIANRVYKGVGFSSELIDACIIEKDKYTCYGVVFKRFLARIIVDKISEILKSTVNV